MSTLLYVVSTSLIVEHCLAFPLWNLAEL